MFTKPLFGRDIPPACEYCSHVVRAADGSLRCTRRGAEGHKKRHGSGQKAALRKLPVHIVVA